MFRWVLTTSVVLSASSSFASFELMLALQQFTPSGASAETSLVRYDPINRVYLGRSALIGVGADAKMALNPTAPGTVDVFQVVSNALNIRRYDYSTGILVSDLSPGISLQTLNAAHYTSNGQMLLSGNFATVGSTHQARLYTSAGLGVRFYSMPSGTTSALDAIIGPDGHTYVLSRAPGTVANSRYLLTTYNPSQSSISSTYTFSDNQPAGIHHSLVLAGNRMNVGGLNLASRRVYTVSGSLLVDNGLALGWASTTQALAMGHGDIVHGLGYNSTTSQTFLTSARLSTGVGDTYFTITNPSLGTVYDTAVVTAPEPATLWAVGAGAAFVLRRKRRK